MFQINEGKNRGEEQRGRTEGMNMNTVRVLVVCVAWFVAAPAMAQNKTPTETQCREMVNGMLQAMKSAPMRTERDRQGAREVSDRAEKIAKDNRSRGGSECDSWRAIGDLAARQ
jgi:hypothetical protein